MSQRFVDYILFKAKTKNILQIENIEKKCQQAKNSFQNQVKQLQSQHNHALETEQTTYKRRLSNFYQRINDRDEAITQLEQSLRETKSAPTSPTIVSFKLTVPQEQYDRDVSRLQLKLDQLKKQPSVDLKSQLIVRNEEIKELKSTIATLEANLKEANAKLAQMTAGEARLKQLAVAENAQMMMHAEARVENLAAEHKQSIIDLEEEYENEKRVLQIKHQTELDQVKQEMLEKQQTLQEEVETRIDVEKENCIQKLNDLELNWKKKFSLNQQQYEQRFDLYKQHKAQLLNEFSKFKREANKTQRELINVS
jgi:hypothetical protein